MTDEEFAQQKDRIRALADRWIGPLGLHWYKIDLAYARDDYQPLGDTSRENSLAKCSTDWRYGTALITWNMPLVREQKDDDLEMAFVHELCHIFLNEMRWTASNDGDSLDHEERVASTLTKAVLWLRDHLKEDA